MDGVAERIVIKGFLQQSSLFRYLQINNQEVLTQGMIFILKEKVIMKLVPCSIKSSLSYLRGLAGIIKESKLTIMPKELRRVNIQAYFWLELKLAIEASRKTFLAFKTQALSDGLVKMTCQTMKNTTMRNDQCLKNHCWKLGQCGRFCNIQLNVLPTILVSNTFYPLLLF